MPKKAGSAKKKGGKGSPVKEAAPVVAAPVAPKIEFPWTQETRKWLPDSLLLRQDIFAEFRKQYIEPETIICNKLEWMSILSGYRIPYKNEKAESMVQIIVSCLAEEATRKTPADDVGYFAASLRCRHGEAHFDRMYKEFDRYLQRVAPPKDVMKLMQEFFAKQTADGYVSRSKLLEVVDGMDIVYAGEQDMDIIHEVKDPYFSFENQSGSHQIFQVFEKLLKKRKYRLVDVFRQIDKDASGEITTDEFRSAVRRGSLQLPLNDRQVKAVIREMDLNGDGVINWEEFMKARDVYREEVRIREESMEELEMTERLPLFGVEAPESISFKFDDLQALVVHCHYITRP